MIVQAPEGDKNAGCVQSDPHFGKQYVLSQRIFNNVHAMRSRNHVSVSIT